MKDIITKKGLPLTSLELQPRPPVMIRKETSFEGKFKLLEELGKGMFGTVQKCQCNETGELFAVKIVRKTTKAKEEVIREVTMMNQLHHQRLVQIHDALETSRQMFIVMELVPGKELFEKVVQDDSLTETQCVHYLKQILNGVDHMHNKNIVHLDLKPENILCMDTSRPGYDEIKLIDFGLARELQSGTSLSVICGTPEFVAPEVINFDPITIQADMWSIGVITYVLLSGISPFLGDDDSETLQNVTLGEFDFEDEDEDETFETISEEAKSFITDLLILRPKKRLSIKECLEHPWLNTPINKGDTIDTTNLKKFIARRRWLRTITAVKAVGRFSASINLLKGNKENSLADTMLAAMKNVANTQNCEDDIIEDCTTTHQNGVCETEQQQSNHINDNDDRSKSDDVKPKQIKVSEIQETSAASIFSHDDGVSDALRKRAERRRQRRLQEEEDGENDIFKNLDSEKDENSPPSQKEGIVETVKNDTDTNMCKEENSGGHCIEPDVDENSYEETKSSDDEHLMRENNGENFVSPQVEGGDQSKEEREDLVDKHKTNTVKEIEKEEESKKEEISQYITTQVDIPKAVSEVEPKVAPKGSSRCTLNEEPNATPKDTPNVAPKDTPKEAPKAVSKNTLKEAPNIAPKTVPKDTPKEPPKVAPMENSEDLPKGEPNIAPKAAPKDISKEAPNAAPKDIPKEAPKAAPKDISKEARNVAPKDIPKEAPKVAPKDISKEARNVAPKDISKEVPKVAPRVAPKDISKKAPKVAPKAAPKDISKEAPNVPPKDIPKEAPKVAPKAAPKDISKEAPNVPPKDIPKEAPKAARKNTPKEAPKVAPKAAPKVSKEAPNVPPKDISKEAPKAAPKDIPKEAPKVAPKDIPKEAPKVALKVAPKDISQEAPNVPPKNIPKEAPKVSPKVSSKVSSKIVSKETLKQISNESPEVAPKVASKNSHTTDSKNTNNQTQGISQTNRRARIQKQPNTEKEIAKTSEKPPVVEENTKTEISHLKNGGCLNDNDIYDVNNKAHKGDSNKGIVTTDKNDNKFVKRSLDRRFSEDPNRPTEKTKRQPIMVRKGSVQSRINAFQ